MRSHFLMPLPCEECTTARASRVGFGRTPIIEASEGSYKQCAAGFQTLWLFAPERLLQQPPHDKMRAEVRPGFNIAGTTLGWPREFTLFDQ